MRNEILFRPKIVQCRRRHTETHPSCSIGARARDHTIFHTNRVPLNRLVVFGSSISPKTIHFDSVFFSFVPLRSCRPRSNSIIVGRVVNSVPLYEVSGEWNPAFVFSTHSRLAKFSFPVGKLRYRTAFQQCQFGSCIHRGRSCVAKVCEAVACVLFIIFMHDYSSLLKSISAAATHSRGTRNTQTPMQ